MATPDPLDQFMIDAAAPMEAGAAETPVARERGEAGQVVYHLLVPLVVGGDRMDRVTLRLPSLDEIERLGRGELAAPRDLMAELAGLPVSTIRALARPDAEMLVGIYELMVP